MFNKLITTILCFLIAANVAMAFILVCAPYQTMAWVETWFSNYENADNQLPAKLNEDFKLLGPATGKVERAD